MKFLIDECLPAAIAAVLRADDLTAGALVVISGTRIRSRRLPVNPPI